MQFENPILFNSEDMTPHQRILSMIRNSRKTLNVVTVFYVLVGFALATVSAFWGDRLGTFLGFVIISGALAFAVLLRVVLRIGLRISNITEHVDVIRSRMDHLEHVLKEVSVQPDKSKSLTAALDLASIGSGDPSVLAAATLDRSRYPRLATTMDLKPPQQTTDMVHEHDMDDNDSIDQAEVIRSSSVNTKNLLRTWKVAIRDGDISMCRSIYSAMLDLADPVQLQQLRFPLEKLADRIENDLRKQFAECMRQEDYAAMFDIGEKICSQLSDRPVAREFERIKPYLLRRLNQSSGYDDSSLKVAP